MSPAERQRQRAVDSLPDPAGRSLALDQIAAAAAAVCGTASGLVTVVDGQAMLTPGRFNSGLRDVARGDSMCQHGIQSPDQVLCVPDLLAQEPYAQLGVARGPEAIRFYAGAPLIVAGEAVGMLCVLDTAPRTALDAEQVRALRRLAKLAVAPLLAMAPQATAA